MLDPGETCDQGGETSTCDADCSVAECGDEYVNAPRGETCDALGESALCNADCTDADCGDGKLNVTAGEQCDDGNDNAADGCSSLCIVEECGNGIVDPGEDCDDEGASPSCDSDCTPVVCGDGVVNGAAAETCDDEVATATCDADCTAPACGDGALNEAAGEECDDGGVMPMDGCDASCLMESVEGTITMQFACDLLGTYFFAIPVDVQIAIQPPPTSGGTFSVVSSAVLTIPAEFGTIFADLGDDTATVSELTVGLGIAGATGGSIALPGAGLPTPIDFDMDDDGIGEPRNVATTETTVMRVNDGATSVSLFVESVHMLFTDLAPIDLPITFPAEPGAAVVCTLPDPNPTATFPAP